MLFKKHIKNKYGITLVELIIAMAVSSLVVGCCIAIIAPSAKAMAQNEKIANAKAITLLIETRLRQSLQYSTKAEIRNTYSGAVQDGMTEFYVNSDGHFVMKKGGTGKAEAEIMEPSMYKGFKVSLVFDKSSSHKNSICANITVTSDDAKINYSIDITVKLLNANEDGTTIVVPSSGAKSTLLFD